MEVRIASVGSAFPRHYFDRQAVVATLEKHWAADERLVRRMEAIHRNTRVDGRHFVLPLEEYSVPRTFGQLNDLWITHALELGCAAASDALARAGMRPADVGSIVFTTVTGLATPSIDARLVHRMGLSPHVKRLPLFGLGCVAGAAGLARAADLAGARRGQVVLLLSVELCSLTFQRDDTSMANVVAAGLFGDGATAVVVTGVPDACTGPRIIDSRAVLYPDTERVMGWDVSERGFHLVLSPDVPEVARAHAREDVDGFLAMHGLTRPDIARWIVHPGGPKVLEALVESLDVAAGALDVTWRSLARVGNISSSSVLLVLKEVLEEDPPPAGSFGVVMAMGPGFCSEMVLLEW